ncbi:MAG TPA: hypothetical protein VE685_12160 [Thermoanaerobaculia bacterium]|nr:hypothetical protein [Thermoanaerobaculia bacterium]
MREALPALALLLALGCVREQIAPPASPQVAPLPTESPQSQPLEEPPTVAAPELATAPEPGTEKGARDFVTGFLQARMARDERLARAFLSPTARDQYEKGEGGLALTRTYAGWDFVSVNAADANSFEVTVRVRERGAGGETAHTETLFVGPGADLEGLARPWVIRGAIREG